MIERFLDSTRFPLRLACIGSDGYPRVISVWFHYVDGRFLCVSHRDSGLIKLLRGNGRVGFEVAPNEPPYHGVRGQGEASISEAGGEEVLAELLQRYLGGADSTLGNWLLSRGPDELLISIEPLRWFSWDYRERMGDTAATG
jgi:nitroimidazol reductase NimA-like FMN-containing flavoprotein (pyridoxamine 5'-phosphate oxidase superfamily)